VKKPRPEPKPKKQPNGDPPERFFFRPKEGDTVDSLTDQILDWIDDLRKKAGLPPMD